MLRELRQNLRSHGYVGDTRLPILCYLTLVSATLEQPVSLLIKGPASSGKSFALACAKRYVPQDAYEQFEAMSERALAYLGDQLDLRHKTLIIQEAAGMASGQGRVFLRQLLTEGAIRYATVQSTRDGLQGTELPPVEGPCGLIMTTTANRIHHEDETRMLSFHVDESPEHILEILLAQSRGISSEPSDEELIPFQNKYRELRDRGLSVDIPYQEQLARHLPRSHPRILRDFPKLISLIKIVALLHSDERESGSEGQVISSLEDYSMVRNLVGESLSQGLEASVPAGVRRVVEAVQELTNRTQGGRTDLPWATVSQRQIANHLEADPSVISRNVYSAIQLDLLQDDNPGQGRTGQLRLGEQVMVSSNVLPPREELEGSL